MALHFAVEWPHALEYLVNSGTESNAEDNHGRRPIHLTIALGYSKAMNILLQATAPWHVYGTLIACFKNL
jgi:hypothetical protein